MITRVCRHCGRAYETFPSIRKQFCSAVCAGLFKRSSKLVPCLVCGTLTKSFPSRPKRYCSKSCARTALNLTDANPSLRRDISGEKNPMWRGGRHAEKVAGPKNGMYGRRRELSARWKGGRRVRKDGYVRVVAPADHPHPSEISATGMPYILEHRLVMERHLGRYLRPEEVVHHLDNNPSNNAIGNLVLYADQSEHARLGHPRRRITQRLRERLALPPPGTA